MPGKGRMPIYGGKGNYLSMTIPVRYQTSENETFSEVTA
jgi:hypothetical protein